MSQALIDPELVSLGKDATVDPGVLLGYPTGRKITDKRLTVGECSVLRSGTVLYAGTRIGSAFQTGHNVVVRERPFVVVSYDALGGRPGARVVLITNGGKEIEGKVAEVSAAGEKIYHVPGGAFYGQTVIDEARGERWVCTEGDALAAGWRKAK